VSTDDPIYCIEVTSARKRCNRLCKTDDERTAQRCKVHLAAVARAVERIEERGRAHLAALRPAGTSVSTDDPIRAAIRATAIRAHLAGHSAEIGRLRDVALAVLDLADRWERADGSASFGAAVAGPFARELRDTVRLGIEKEG
jgi:hypothetical protein